METVKNLLKAFIGESQARNRYTLYAKTAAEEGFEQISEIFLRTADNERVHAKWLFRMVKDLNKNKQSEFIVDAIAPTMLGKTTDNLKAAIKGENYENQIMYPEFANVADKEGFIDIGKRLRAIALAEKNHEERYKKLLNEVEKGTVFKKKEMMYWECKKCGYVHYGKEPPEKCPACYHKKNYFEIKSEIY